MVKRDRLSHGRDKHDELSPKQAQALLVLVLLCSGCGAATPQLHPAHPLPQGKSEFGAGFSANMLLGASARRLERAKEAHTRGEQGDATVLDGVFSEALLGPGIAPWFHARLGLGHNSEVALSYSARNVRVGARHAISEEELAFSFGLGASALHTGGEVDDAEGSTALRPDMSGVGVDAELTLGWRSVAQLVSIWFGVRPGFEALAGDYLLAEGSAEVSGQRWFLAASLGISVGVPPIWVRAELNPTVNWANGTARMEQLPAPSRSRFSGFSLAPAGAIVVEF